MSFYVQIVGCLAKLMFILTLATLVVGWNLYWNQPMFILDWSYLAWSACVFEWRQVYMWLDNANTLFPCDIRPLWPSYSTLYNSYLTAWSLTPPLAMVLLFKNKIYTLPDQLSLLGQVFIWFDKFCVLCASDFFSLVSEFQKLVLTG